MRRGPAALIALAILVGLPLVPAEAVTSFGPVVRVSPTGCSHAVSATSSGGTTRGYYVCSSGWRAFQGSGSSWSSSASPYTTSTDVLAVAVDGSRTWQVTTDSTGTWLRSRIGSTYYGGKRLTTARVERGDAAVVAVNGRYHVVWAQPNPKTGGALLYEARTLNGTISPRLAYGTATQSARDASPALAYQSSTGKVVLTWTHSITQSQMSVHMRTTLGTSWGATRTVATNAFTSSIAVSGSRVVIGYRTYVGTCGCSGRVALGTTSGITGRHAVTGQLDGRILVGASGGVVSAVWRSRFSPYPARVAAYASGSWSERTLSSPSPNVILSAASVNGKLRFLAWYGSYVGMRSQ